MNNTQSSCVVCMLAWLKVPGKWVGNGDTGGQCDFLRGSVSSSGDASLLFLSVSGVCGDTFSNPVISLWLSQSLAVGVHVYHVKKSTAKLYLDLLCHSWLTKINLKAKLFSSWIQIARLIWLLTLAYCVCGLKTCKSINDVMEFRVNVDWQLAWAWPVVPNLDLCLNSLCPRRDKRKPLAQCRSNQEQRTLAC